MTEAQLPRGIWFEEGRGRYRVRIYHRQQIIWRSYHFTLDDALDAHQHALELQRSWRPSAPVVRNPYPKSVLELF